MRISTTRSNVTALGPGRRFGVWLQGCGFACRGCLAHDTWRPGGSHVSPGELMNELESAPCDGISISGGEPLDQADELVEFLSLLRSERPELDVLIYTGFDETEASARFPDVFELADAVICGRYEARRAADEHWRGSDNQTVVFGDRTRQAQRLRVWIERPERDHHLQIGLDDDTLWIVGIPRRGDLASLDRQLREQGLDLTNAGWHRATAQLPEDT